MELPLNKIEALAARNLTEQQIADVLNINMVTLRADKQQFAVYRDAIRKGKSKGYADIANALYAKAKQGDSRAAELLLRNAKG